MKAEQFYKEQIQKIDKQLVTINRKVGQLAWARTSTFIASLVVLFFFLSEEKPEIALASSFLVFVLFLVLVKQFTKWKFQQRFFFNKKEINQNELKALAYDFSAFKGGEAYKDGDHVYSYDLDVFGEGSIFQFLNTLLFLTILVIERKL